MIWQSKLKSTITGLERTIAALESSATNSQSTIAGLYATLAALESSVTNSQSTIAGLEARLRQQEQELRLANERCDELQAHVTFLHNPQNLRTTHDLVAFLLSHDRPLPDDFQEHALRLQLRQTP